MTRARISQTELDRIARAAAKVGYSVRIDLDNMTVTMFPPSAIDADGPSMAEDGEEDWDVET